MAAASCRSPGLYISGEQAAKSRESINNGSFEKMSFRAKVIFKERELSGIMLFKKAPDGNYRIAFYNELGMTYLEGTLDNSSKHNNLIVKNIAPDIDHKIFLKNFEKCLDAVFPGKLNPRFPARTTGVVRSQPPRPHDSMPPAKDEDMISVYLRNGFELELSPQIAKINTD
jgi:hypothetical protein